MWTRTLLLLGGVALLYGLFMGWTPITAEGVKCGSAWSPSKDAKWQADMQDSVTVRAASGCLDTRSERMPSANAWTVIGALLLVGGFAVAMTEESRKYRPSTVTSGATT